MKRSKSQEEMSSKDTRKTLEDRIVEELNRRDSKVDIESFRREISDDLNTFLSNNLKEEMGNIDHQEYRTSKRYMFNRPKTSTFSQFFSFWC